MSNKNNPFGEPKDEMVEDVFSIDMTDQKDPNVIEDGAYVGKLIGVEKQTSKTGNPMWV